MRRTNEGEPEETPPSKKQATLGNFFQRRSGVPLPGPLFVEQASLKCPYCDFVVRSEFEPSLAGNLKNHCVHKHTIEVVEAKARIDGALRFVERCVFDFTPLPPIPETPELPSATSDSGAKVLRHSYTIKQKYFLLKDYEAAEERLKTRLQPSDSLFSVSVRELVSRTSGVPISTIKDWLKSKSQIVATYNERLKLKRLKKRLGSGRHALFPKSEAKVLNW